MLNSLIPLATDLLSSGEDWLWNAPFAQRAVDTPLIPHEPSTLALALVGIATVAIYIAATRWRLPRGTISTEAGRRNVARLHRPAAKSTDKRPTRGAA